jgi:hypothetical protein
MRRSASELATLALGYRPHGSPAIIHDGNALAVAQTVVWPEPRITLNHRGVAPATEVAPKCR